MDLDSLASRRRAWTLKNPPNMLAGCEIMKHSRRRSHFSFIALQPTALISLSLSPYYVRILDLILLHAADCILPFASKASRKPHWGPRFRVISAFHKNRVYTVTEQSGRDNSVSTASTLPSWHTIIPKVVTMATQPET
jgi:hypothetical protein